MDAPDIVSQLTNLVIRPHRQIYGIDRLGDKKILIKSKITKQYIHIVRRDVTLNNMRKIQLSIFQPESPQNHPQNNFNSTNSTNLPHHVVVFLHSNSGSRLEGMDYIKTILQEGMIAVLFDYCGSGISQGEYVTMGINEAKDLGEVYCYLRQNYAVDKICLWGRSMGAVTAIIYGSRFPDQISAAVLDSPFCSFNELIRDLVRNKTGLPDFFFTPIINKIADCIKQKTNQDLFEIDLRKNINRMKSVRCLFLTSKNDQLVPIEHTRQLYNLHGGIKDVIYLQGNHNEPRPPELKQKCAQFLLKNPCQNISTKSSLKHYKPSTFHQNKHHFTTTINRQSQNNTLLSPKNHQIIIPKSSITIALTPKSPKDNFNPSHSDQFIHTAQSYGRRQQHQNERKGQKIFRLSAKYARQSFINHPNQPNEQVKKNINMQSYQQQNNFSHQQLKGQLSSKVSLSIFKKSMIVSPPCSNLESQTPYRYKLHQSKPENNIMVHSAKTIPKNVQSQKIMKKNTCQPIKQHINLCGQVPNQSQTSQVYNKLNTHTKQHIYQKQTKLKSKFKQQTHH